VGAINGARLPVPELPVLGIHATVPGLIVQGVIVILFALALVHTFVRRARSGDPALPTR
jgi:hypothetical protein